MKTNHLKFLLLLCLLSLFPVLVSGQLSPGDVKLVYITDIPVSVPLIVESSKGKPEDVGVITIKIKYFLDKTGADKLQMSINPVTPAGRENFILLFDRQSTIDNVLKNQDSRPKRDGYFLDLTKTLKPFIEVKGNPGLLVPEEPSFNKGVMYIDKKVQKPIIYKLNRKNTTPERLELTINMYSGKSKEWSDKFQAINVSIILPAEFNCKEYLRDFNLSYKADYEYRALVLEAADPKNNNTTGYSRINSKIDKAIAAFDKLKDIKRSIDVDPRRFKCRELVSLSDSISHLLALNDLAKFNNLKFSLNALKEGRKPDSLNHLQPSIPLVQEVKPVTGKDEALQEKARTSEPKDKKSPAVVPCEDFLKKNETLLKTVAGMFRAEEFRTVTAGLKSQLGSIVLLINEKKADTQTDKDKLKEEVLQISSENKETGSKLDKYEEDFSRLESITDSRKDCETKDLSNEIDSLQRAVAILKEEWSGINAGLTRIMSDVFPDNQRRMDQLRADFSPAFYSVLTDFIGLKTSLSILSDRFRKKNNSGMYYNWEKEKLFTRFNACNLMYSSVSNRFDSINKAADSAFSSQFGGMGAIWGDTTEENIAAIKQLKNSVNNQIFQLENDISESIPDRFPWTMLIIAVFVVFTLLFGAWVYYHALVKRKKRQADVVDVKPLEGRFNHPGSLASGKDKVASADTETEPAKEHIPEPQKIGGITITRSIPDGKGRHNLDAGRGLEHVIDNAGADFFCIDLNDIWADTLVRKVYIHRSCIKKTYKFFFESCAAEGKIPETGGYLIGAWEPDRQDPKKYNVSLEDFIEPGDDAIYEEYQLNFGAKIGVRLERLIQDYREKSGREYTLTAWFHSHPEIKIFLSNHDLDVQERLSSKEHKHKLLALVIDPNTQEDHKMAFLTGIFSYKSNGAMNNNPGEMKLVKWKDLYEWAITPPVHEIKDHYCIEFNHIFSRSLISRLYLNDKCITRFSLFLDELPANPDASGFFTGEIIKNGNEVNQSVIFTDFIEGLPGDIPGVVGRFFGMEDPDTRIAMIMSGQEAIPDAGILLFCQNMNKDLVILTKKDGYSYNLRKDVRKIIPFSEIETWPTRRR
ncbi:MAG: hypothetical protein V1775_08255 [Bacteroidota bacterium]